MITIGDSKGLVRDHHLVPFGHTSTKLCILQSNFNHYFTMSCVSKFLIVWGCSKLEVSRCDIHDGAVTQLNSADKHNSKSSNHPAPSLHILLPESTRLLNVDNCCLPSKDHW